MFRIILSLIALLPSVVHAGISRNNEVDWVAASSVSSSNSHFVQWVNPLQVSSDCVTPNGKARTRLSIDDKELFSLLLAAKSAKLKVGFYYKTQATSGAVPGHGTDCQIVNAWIESN